MVQFLDPAASTPVTPVLPSQSPLTLSSFIGEPTPRASPTTFKQEDIPWETNYKSETLPDSSPPIATLEFGDVSDNDSEYELDPCNGQLIEWTPGSVWDTYA